jgi:hypothetical protein
MKKTYFIFRCWAIFAIAMCSYGLASAQTHITDRAGLAAISGSGNYILDNDIDLSGSNWTPLGNFTGTLDGNGHVIYNLTINDLDMAAFFSTISGNALVKNLGFEKASVTDATHARTAIVAAFLKGSAVIENCYIANSYIKGRWCTGSFVGRATEITDGGNAAIRNCYSSACITVPYHSENAGMTGGIIGNIYDGNKIIVENCYFSGIIDKDPTTVKTEGSIAGIAGWIGKDETQTISGYTVQNNVNLSPYLLSDDGKNRISSVRGGGNGDNDPTPGPNYSLSATVVDVYNAWGSSAIVTTGAAANKDGANIPGGDANAKTQSFYETTLGWDFDNVWTIDENNIYPVLQWTAATRPYFVVRKDAVSITGDETADLKKYIFSGRGLSLTFTSESDKVIINNGLVSIAQPIAAVEKVTVSVQEGSLTDRYSLEITLLPEYITIAVPEDLNRLRTAPSAKYILTADLDLSGTENFTPIPNFAGVLDGDGHIISGLSINAGTATNSDLTAFIAKTSDGAVIKNLGFENANILSCGSRVAVVVGRIEGSATIENCYVANSAVSGRWCVGSIAGRIQTTGKVLIRSCYSSAYITIPEITGQGTGQAGGIAGNIFTGSNSVVENCYFSGIIHRTSYDGMINATEGQVAGIIGWIGKDGDQGITGYAIQNNVNLAPYLLNDYGKHRISSTRSDEAVNDPAPGPNYSLSTTVVSGYNDWGNTSAIVTSGAGTSKDGANIPNGDAAAKTAAFYTGLGWNFDDVWTIDENNSYPRFKSADQTRPHFVVPQTQISLTSETPVNLSSYIFSGRGLPLTFTSESDKIIINNGVVSLAQPVLTEETVTVSVREGALTPVHTLEINLVSDILVVTLLSSDDSSLKIKLNRPVQLTAANFTLQNVTGNSPVAITSVGQRGEEYTLEAGLPAGAVYSLTIAKEGYDFGEPLRFDKSGGRTPSGQPIDREALVKRHTVHLDNLSQDELPQVGNGEIGFSIDATGLQTFYGNTMSHWSWHTVPCPPELYTGYDKPHDALKLQQYSYNGRQLGLRTTSSGQTALYNWIRENPHRFNLGRLRFLLTKNDGTQISAGDVKDVDQTLDLWRGVITSRYTIEGVPVSVETCVEPAGGELAVRVTSPLITMERLKVEWAFPYGHHGNSGADWTKPEKHRSTLSQRDNRLEVVREMDDMQYYAVLACETEAALSEPSAHTFVVAPGKQSDTFAFTVHYSPGYTDNLPAVDAAFAASEEGWENFWRSGGAVDLSESADARWEELERRIVLSQYLLAVNSSGSLPPQESGLFSNTGEWNGKFHLEMHWWHDAHYALWGRFSLFEPSLQYYRDALPKARELAQSQGFKGARFVKMSGPDNEDAPSFTGPLIIWQQPHPIFYAELEYRLNPSREVLEKWQGVVQETADFMADFAYYDSSTDRYVLGPPMASVPENTNYSTTKNPAFELSYWHTGLRWAQIWRQRLGLEREEHWDEVMEKLSDLPVQDGLYLQQEGMTNTYTGMNYEHPSLIGPGGMLPYNGADRETVKRTVAKVWDVWQWDRCWGWDFPMMAMAAARNGWQSIAIEALLHPSAKNAMNRVGLSTGGPYPYFPANGGLLYAIALMSAGWDDAPDVSAPGFPNDGVSWKVRYEGLSKAPESFETIGTGIRNPAVSGSNIIVYPNPARQTVCVQSSSPVKNMRIYNLQGVNVANSKGMKKEIDVSALPGGVYQVKIETDKEVVVKKILVGN